MKKYIAPELNTILMNNVDLLTLSTAETGNAPEWNFDDLIKL